MLNLLNNKVTLRPGHIEALYSHTVINHDYEDNILTSGILGAHREWLTVESDRLSGDILNSMKYPRKNCQPNENREDCFSPVGIMLRHHVRIKVLVARTIM